MGPDQRRELFKIMMRACDIRLRRALQLIDMSSPKHYYKPRRDDSEH